MNDRNIPVYLSPDNIALIQAALREARQTGADEDRGWLDGYLSEHLTKEE